MITFKTCILNNYFEKKNNFISYAQYSSTFEEHNQYKYMFNESDNVIPAKFR